MDPARSPDQTMPRRLRLNFSSAAQLPITEAVAQGEEIDLGTAGASARREYERRRAKREAATRERHPHLGGALLRLQSAPGSERAWETGAVGEEELAALLSSRCSEALVLHDRRIPGTRTNIDHLAVAPTGVYVIDAKRYRGKIEVREPLLGPATLRIAGRDKSKLVAGLSKQQGLVRSTLDPVVPEMPILGCFCFLNPAGQAGGSGLPLLRRLVIDGFPLYSPRRLAKTLNEAGALSALSRAEVATILADRFPPA